MEVELKLSGTASTRCLLRIALSRVSMIRLEMPKERMKEFSRPFVFLYRMLGREAVI